MPTIPYDPAEGFASNWTYTQKPDPRHDLRENVKRLWAEYDETFDLWERGVVDNDTLEKYRAIAQAAQDELYNYEPDEEPCTCKPDGDLCPGCRDAVQAIYQNELPY